MNPIYIGTVLLEQNRWARGKEPTFQVSEWLSRFQAAGFTGMELWENHAALAKSEELSLLEHNAFPVAIYNSYCDFTNKGEKGRIQAADLATRLNAQGVKFNLGSTPALRDEYVANAAKWRRLLPANTKLLCECHPGTIMEEPECASEVYAAWGGAEFQAMIHPFTTPLDTLKRWFACLGPRITHAHVQLRDETGACRGLFYNKPLVKQTLHMMHEEGFSGSFTLEFTEGTQQPGEHIDGLYKAALDDLAFLQECLAALG